MLRATIPHLPVKPSEVEDIAVGMVQGRGTLHFEARVNLTIRRTGSERLAHSAAARSMILSSSKHGRLL
jgi:hypothetical protein